MIRQHSSKAAAVLAAALLLAPLSAGAADVYTSYKDTPIYVPVNVWSGFYAGVNGGYGWSGSNRPLTTSTDWVYLGDGFETGTYNAAIGKLNAEGGFGGGQFGYNAQRGNIVFGFEVDAQGSGINGKASTSIDASDLVEGLTINGAAKSELEWFGTLRGRFGYAAGPMLLYVTGGLAVGGVKDTLSLSSSPDYGSFTFSNSQTRAGYVLGGGLEYMISPSWSLKAEYQFIDLGSTTVKGSIFSTDGETYLVAGQLATSRIDHSYNTVRIGLNYHLTPAYEPLK